MRERVGVHWTSFSEFEKKRASQDPAGFFLSLKRAIMIVVILKEYPMKGNAIIRKMIESDIKHLSQGFINQGWPGREEILARYFLEQESGEREVLVAEIDAAVAGYVTILPSAKAEVYPELSDFNVFESFRNQGIGNQLLEEAEKRVKFVSSKVTLGVGLHSGYGPAQRLYIRRGYIPDGTGVWYRNQPLEMNATSQNNDDLVLYLSKDLQ